MYVTPARLKVVALEFAAAVSLLTRMVQGGVVTRISTVLKGRRYIWRVFSVPTDATLVISSAPDIDPLSSRNLS